MFECGLGMKKNRGRGRFESTFSARSAGRLKAGMTENRTMEAKATGIRKHPGRSLPGSRRVPPTKSRRSVGVCSASLIGKSFSRYRFANAPGRKSANGDTRLRRPSAAFTSMDSIRIQRTTRACAAGLVTSRASGRFGRRPSAPSKPARGTINRTRVAKTARWACRRLRKSKPTISGQGRAWPSGISCIKSMPRWGTTCRFASGSRARPGSGSMRPRRLRIPLSLMA